jgi:electron transfer flavoprotein alpha/beta subunit
MTRRRWSWPRLRDQAQAHGESLALSAVTVGNATADRVLKTLLALRFERASRLPPAVGPDLLSGAVARLLAEFAGKVQRFLFLGRQSNDDAGGLVPALVATALGWPLIADVVDARYVAGGRLEATCRHAAGSLILTLGAPAVLAIDDTVAAAMRVPTLKDRMSHGKRPVEIGDIGGMPDDGFARLQPAPAGFADVVDRRRAGMIDGRDGAALPALLSAWRAATGGRP